VSTSTTLLEPAVVRLRRDLPDDEVKAGETRTIVHADEGGAGQEVEFLGERKRPKLVTVENGGHGTGGLMEPPPNPPPPCWPASVLSGRPNP
jgi:hypothetical protein